MAGVAARERVRLSRDSAAGRWEIVLPSYRAARMAFDVARLEWPSIRWVWAEQREDGTWNVEG
jgi:hypothetical protein